MAARLLCNVPVLLSIVHLGDVAENPHQPSVSVFDFHFNGAPNGQIGGAVQRVAICKPLCHTPVVGSIAEWHPRPTFLLLRRPATTAD